jgi:hypothetical protein
LRCPEIHSENMKQKDKKQRIELIYLPGANFYGKSDETDLLDPDQFQIDQAIHTARTLGSTRIYIYLSVIIYVKFHNSRKLYLLKGGKYVEKETVDITTRFNIKPS